MPILGPNMARKKKNLLEIDSETLWDTIFEDIVQLADTLESFPHLGTDPCFQQILVDLYSMHGRIGERSAQLMARAEVANLAEFLAGVFEKQNSGQLGYQQTLEQIGGYLADIHYLDPSAPSAKKAIKDLACRTRESRRGGPVLASHRQVAKFTGYSQRQINNIVMEHRKNPDFYYSNLCGHESILRRYFRWREPAIKAAMETNREEFRIRHEEHQKWLLQHGKPLKTPADPVKALKYELRNGGMPPWLEARIRRIKAGTIEAFSIPVPERDWLPSRITRKGKSIKRTLVRKLK